MALTPRLQLLNSPLEGEEDFTQVRGKEMKVGRPPGPHLVRDLYRWAEYHQRQFSKRITQQRLGALDMGILNREKLQAGSNIREYQGFLKALEARGTRTHTAKVLTLSRTPV